MRSRTLGGRPVRRRALSSSRVVSSSWMQIMRNYRRTVSSRLDAGPVKTQGALMERRQQRGIASVASQARTTSSMSIGLPKTVSGPSRAARASRT